MSDYPEDTEGRKKALAANNKFHEQIHDNGSTETYSKLNDVDNVELAELVAACKKLIEIKPYLDSFNPYNNKSESYKLVTVRSHGNLMSASWHIQQALKVMHEECTEDELNCEVYGFWLDSSRSIIKLQHYYIQSRATKRHHFKSSKVWSRLDRRGSNIERPVVRECVKTKAIEILVDSIKFEED